MNSHQGEFTVGLPIQLGVHLCRPVTISIETAPNAALANDHEGYWYSLLLTGELTSWRCLKRVFKIACSCFDLPLKFRPADFRVSTTCTPYWPKLRPERAAMSERCAEPDLRRGYGRARTWTGRQYRMCLISAEIGPRDLGPVTAVCNLESLRVELAKFLEDLRCLDRLNPHLFRYVGTLSINIGTFSIKFPAE